MAKKASTLFKVLIWLFVLVLIIGAFAGIFYALKQLDKDGIIADQPVEAGTEDVMFLMPYYSRSFVSTCSQYVSEDFVSDPDNYQGYSIEFRLTTGKIDSAKFYLGNLLDNLNDYDYEVTYTLYDSSYTALVTNVSALDKEGIFTVNVPFSITIDKVVNTTLNQEVLLKPIMLRYAENTLKTMNATFIKPGKYNYLYGFADYSLMSYMNEYYGGLTHSDIDTVGQAYKMYDYSSIKNKKNNLYVYDYLNLVGGDGENIEFKEVEVEENIDYHPYYFTSSLVVPTELTIGIQKYYIGNQFPEYDLSKIEVYVRTSNDSVGGWYPVDENGFFSLSIKNEGLRSVKNGNLFTININAVRYDKTIRLPFNHAIKVTNVDSGKFYNSPSAYYGKSIGWVSNNSKELEKFASDYTVLN